MQKDLITSLLQKDYVMPKELENSVQKTLMNALLSPVQCQTAVLSDINSAQTLFKLLDDFKNFSGLEVNPTKTEGMWIGSSRENETKPFGIKWPNKPIKALGVYYSYDQKLLHEKNFIENLDSVK